MWLVSDENLPNFDCDFPSQGLAELGLIAFIGDFMVELIKVV